MLTLSLFSVPVPGIILMPSDSTTYEIGGTVTVTLVCMAYTSADSFKWKVDNTAM